MRHTCEMRGGHRGTRGGHGGHGADGMRRGDNVVLCL